MTGPLYLPILGSVSAFLLTLSLIPTRDKLSEALEEYQPGRSERKESRVEELVGKAFSGKARGALAQALMEAGWYKVTPVQIALRVVAGAIGGIALVILFSMFVHLATWMMIVGSVLIIAFCTQAPISMIGNARRARKADVQRTLPDLLDIVATTVQAGLSVNAALAYAVDAIRGALSEELKEALAEIRLGRSRAEALTAAATRLNQIEFTTTVTALVQAERLGANIAKVLIELAEDTRNQRIMLAEEQAAKLPVKMAFPMAFFMLPAIFTVIFGTVIANLMVPK